jgi:hypothetical protein
LQARKLSCDEPGHVVYILGVHLIVNVSEFTGIDKRNVVRISFRIGCGFR